MRRETLQLAVEVGREEDGRWFAEIPDIRGCVAREETREQLPLAAPPLEAY